jgi:hypothetical protein
MIALHGLEIVEVPLAEALRDPKRIEVSGDAVLTARAMGISFGD